MKFEISQSLKGNKVIFIARDPLGTVRLREPSLEKLEKAIKDFNKPKPVAKKEKQQGEKKFLINNLATTIKERKLVLSEAEGEELEKPSEEKKQPRKKSFWDKLK